MAKKEITATTTEFYRNPSKFMKDVKAGKEVVIKYKNHNVPLAVLKPYKKKSATKKDLDHYKKIMDYLEKNPFTPQHYKSGLDLQNAVRE